MTQLPSAFLLLLTSAACTSTGPTARPVFQTAPADDPEPNPPPVKKPLAQVTVAVGSVLLRDDCPGSDPVGALDPLIPASTVPPAEAPAVMPRSAAKRKPGPPGASPRRGCEQSTLQLTFDNPTGQPAEVRVIQVRLRDTATGTVVATLDARAPTQWSESSNAYAPWDQRVDASTSVKSSYRIKPPRWSAVQSKLGGVNSRHRTFEVEVAVAINGRKVTAHSAGFTRPPVVPMPPT